VIVWRLSKAAFTAPDGEGARLYGGRWNSPGRPMVYAAASPSLAVLEVMVHLDLPADLLPDDYRMLQVELPDAAPVERLPATPTDPIECAALGDAFLARGAALTLLVPSIVVPMECNALVNPLHPAMRDVRIAADEPFGFDSRLFGR
jgi:RES domain-containing protein